MCSAIRQKVSEIKEAVELNLDLNGKIPLYVTGHSLGGALATLFYCRLRKGKDLDDICELRDAYTYGCPAVGDTDFATGYERSLNPMQLTVVTLAFHLTIRSTFGG
jgi:predicted lipase